jgi:hypothetical protein
MRRNIVVACITLGLAGIAAFVIFSGQSLWGPSDAIRRRLLGVTPLGTDFNEVDRVLTKRAISHDLRNTGFIPGGGANLANTVGVKSIHADLGDYRMILVTSVTANYGFDVRGKLIEVEVKKEVDAP